MKSTEKLEPHNQKGSMENEYQEEKILSIYY